jgi:hypothetical protein
MLYLLDEGVGSELYKEAIALLFTFLAGGVILNVKAVFGRLPSVQEFMQYYCWHCNAIATFKKLLSS